VSHSNRDSASIQHGRNLYAVVLETKHNISMISIESIYELYFDYDSIGGSIFMIIVGSIYLLSTLSVKDNPVNSLDWMWFLAGFSFYLFFYVPLINCSLFNQIKEWFESKVRIGWWFVIASVIMVIVLFGINSIVSSFPVTDLVNGLIAAIIVHNISIIIVNAQL
jgi:hypothetical protein